MAMASPCIVAIPTRSPVNDPGPVATANRSISRSESDSTCEEALPGRRAAAPPAPERRHRPPREASPIPASVRSFPDASSCRVRGLPFA